MSKFQIRCRTLITGVFMAVMIVASVPHALAQSELVVGKAVAEAFSFVPLDIGIRKGFFEEEGLSVKSVAFAGDAKMQQGMAGGTVNLGLGSGPGMAFVKKGAPVQAVAAMAGPPLLLTITVGPDGPASAQELKGKKIGVSTLGSLTYFLVKETSRREGWGPDGIEAVPLGATKGQIAALARGEIDGFVTDIATALTMEQEGRGRIVRRFKDIEDFHIHVIFATNDTIANNPDDVRAFLRGWFKTIQFMHGNKAETVEIAAEVMNKSEKIAEETYDELMSMFSDTGVFSDSAMETLTNSFVELGMLDEKPDPKELYTEEFLPEQMN